MKQELHDMSIKIFVLGEQFDQSAFRNGGKPENYVEREFQTEKELKLYRSAMTAAAGLCDHRIMEIGDASVKINRWWAKLGGNGTTKTFNFKTDGEKQAIFHGLEDGDGCLEPEIIRQNEGVGGLDYDTLTFIIEHGRAPTDDELDELSPAPAAMGI
jgi:hypothetical protein